MSPGPIIMNFDFDVESEPRHVCCSKWRCVRTAASQNFHSCQFADKQADKQAERGYYDESDIVLCVN